MIHRFEPGRQQCRPALADLQNPINCRDVALPGLRPQRDQKLIKPGQLNIDFVPATFTKIATAGQCFLHGHPGSRSGAVAELLRYLFVRRASQPKLERSTASLSGLA